MPTPQPLRFERSMFCQAGACVEVARAADGARVVRDSKDDVSPQLIFTADEWQAFVAGVKAGQFD